MSTPPGLHHLMARTAVRTSGALAVAGPCGPVTYAQLDDRANILANTLASHGVGRGDRVLIWSPKSAAAIAAMQAVLRLGAAYVPVEPLAPAERVALIARESAARALCAPAALLARATHSLRDDLVCVDPEDLPLPDARLSTPVNSPVEPDDLAYILYTSGSTGTPKGVCISHRNAIAFVEWVVAELAPGPWDRFANHAAFSFDLSVLDIYAAFAVGAAVCPMPAELAYSPKRLVEFLRQERISIWYSVPSVLILMQRDGGLLDQPAPAQLRALLFAGEPFPIGYVRQLAEWTNARLLNLYGPTETNVCTYHEVRPADLRRNVPVPIGKACSGDRVWARKPDGTMANRGEEGELLVSGPTVFLGYWGQPLHEGPYATGDRVRILPDGSFDYLGRGDDMVKVRGHRIELGEVTAALHTHPEVAEAAVAVVGQGLDRRLAAFVIRSPGSAFGSVALRRHLARQLPPHMIPDDVCFVEQLPRNARGKIDFAALPLHTTNKE